MKRLLSLAGVAALAVACATTPFTHRSQLMLVSESQAEELGAAAFQEVLAKTEVESDPRYADPVRSVGQRIAAVAAPRTDVAQGDWRFVALDDPDVQNAFALPGGKVGVYTGMFPVAQTTQGLAVVLGHEIGHVVARHGSERMSQALATQLGGTALGAALGSGSGTQAVLAAYGLGAQLGVLLPFSRTQEREADRIGLILMAEAGYDPRAAVDFWQRMERATGADGQPPQFLSTHPGHAERVADIRAHLPEALAYYRGDTHPPVRPLPPVSK